MSSARTDILGRIRSVQHGPTPPTAHRYRRAGTLATDARIALFCERVSDYRAWVHRVPEAEVADTVASVCRGLRIVVPPGLPSIWRPPGIELVEDGGLSPHDLDSLDGAVTGCTVAIAETGTIVLAAGPAEGRRALTLVPDLHVCIVREEQIVELVPEATATLGELVRQERRPLTLVSGPSATSDIELIRVEGVHGPRKLVVIVTGRGYRTGRSARHALELPCRLATAPTCPGG